MSFFDRIKQAARKAVDSLPPFKLWREPKPEPKYTPPPSRDTPKTRTTGYTPPERDTGFNLWEGEKDYFDNLDDEFGLSSLLEGHGWSPDDFRDIIRDVSANDIPSDEWRPHTTTELEDMLYWLEDAGIEQMAYIWYDWDTGEWHYAVDWDS